LNPQPYPLNSSRLPIISTVPTLMAGRDGSALHSRLSANCPRNVLIAGVDTPASAALRRTFSASFVVWSTTVRRFTT